MRRSRGSSVGMSGAGGVVQRGAEVVSPGRAGEVRGGVDRRHPDRGERSPEVNSDFEQIAREIAGRDQGHRRGRGRGVSARRAAMSCPSSCARRRGGASSSARPGTIAERDDGALGSWPSRSPSGPEEVALELDAERIVARTQGREGWLREGRRQVEQHRWENPDPIPRARCGAAAVGGRAAGHRSRRGTSC